MMRSLPASLTFWIRFFSSSSSGVRKCLCCKRCELLLELEVLLVVAPQLRIPIDQRPDQLFVVFLHAGKLRAERVGVV